MMSASAISAAIKAKKKKMEDEKDAQDVVVDKNQESGDSMSDNSPMGHDEAPSMAAEMSSEKKAPEEDEEAKAHRQAKIMALMSRMGK